jgi:hypothetical protein
VLVDLVALPRHREAQPEAGAMAALKLDLGAERAQPAAGHNADARAEGVGLLH